MVRSKERRDTDDAEVSIQGWRGAQVCRANYGKGKEPSKFQQDNPWRCQMECKQRLRTESRNHQ